MSLLFWTDIMQMSEDRGENRMKTLSQLFAQIKNKHDSDDQTNIKNQKTIKVVSMKGTYYPENGTLTQNQLEKLANLKKDGSKIVLFTDKGISKMEEGNVLLADWDAVIAANGYTLLNEQLILMEHIRTRNAFNNAISSLANYWNLGEFKAQFQIGCIEN